MPERHPWVTFNDPAGSPLSKGQHKNWLMARPFRPEISHYPVAGTLANTEMSMHNALNYHQSEGDRAIETATGKVPDATRSAPAQHDIVIAISGTRPATSRPATGALSDNALLARLKHNRLDTEAADALIKRHWKPLFSQCRMLTSDANEAFVLAQTTWKYALQVLPKLPAPDDLRTLLVQTATKLWRNQLPSRQPSAAAAIIGSSRDHSETIDNIIKISLNGTMIGNLKIMVATEQASLRREIDMALDGLAPTERDVILAHYLKGESQAEIGRRYHQSEEIVSGWLKTALGRIKTHFDPHGSSPGFTGNPN